MVARFLALLELFREGAVVFEQVDPLGELHVRWTGTDEGDVEVPDEFDEEIVAEGDDDSSDDSGDEPEPTDVPDDTTIDLRETSTDDDA